MALCIPKSFYYHCACRVEISQNVFHGSIQELRFWWGVYHGFAYVFSGAVYMALLGEFFWSQVFQLFRVVYEKLSTRGVAHRIGIFVLGLCASVICKRWLAALGPKWYLHLSGSWNCSSVVKLTCRLATAGSITSTGLFRKTTMLLTLEQEEE